MISCSYFSFNLHLDGRMRCAAQMRIHSALTGVVHFRDNFSSWKVEISIYKDVLKTQQVWNDKNAPAIHRHVAQSMSCVDWNFCRIVFSLELAAPNLMSGNEKILYIHIQKMIVFCFGCFIQWMDRVNVRFHLNVVLLFERKYIFQILQGCRRRFSTLPQTSCYDGLKSFRTNFVWHFDFLFPVGTGEGKWRTQVMNKECKNFA